MRRSCPTSPSRSCRSAPSAGLPGQAFTTSRRPPGSRTSTAPTSPPVSRPTISRCRPVAAASAASASRSGGVPSGGIGASVPRPPSSTIPADGRRRGLGEGRRLHRRCLPADRGGDDLGARPGCDPVGLHLRRRPRLGWALLPPRRPPRPLRREPCAAAARPRPRPGGPRGRPARLRAPRRPARRLCLDDVHARAHRPGQPRPAHGPAHVLLLRGAVRLDRDARSSRRRASASGSRTCTGSRPRASTRR